MDERKVKMFFEEFKNLPHDRQDEFLKNKRLEVDAIHKVKHIYCRMHV
jgi:hypothetical protein